MIGVTIDGRELPCRPTMGAMLRYKEATGREATTIDATSVTDLVTYLWCCVVSACKRDGIAFDMSLMDFADGLDPEAITKWTESLMAESKPEEGDEEKKSR
ncbi:MAG: hypothetical protein IKH15_06610 [Bacteroidales bacterium]|nr:hypothetical protein [Bacteroidales bacterium]MBR7051600.1 hypothetical protein [Bacteroidaceae bacterium]